MSSRFKKPLASITYVLFTGLVFISFYIPYWPANSVRDYSVQREKVESSEPEEVLLPHLVPYNPKLPTDYGHVPVPEQYLSEMGTLIFNRTNGKKHGFFVEFRAYDGFFASNTLMLERDHQWNGLLIEVEPPAVEILKKINRKAWIAEVCLSPEPRPMILRINRLKRTLNHFVTCYPLHTLLDAVGVHQVDFFSLRAEGWDYAILKTIPWSRVRVKFISVEALMEKAREMVQSYLEEKGYTKIASITSEQDILSEIDVYELTQS